MIAWERKAKRKADQRNFPLTIKVKTKTCAEEWVLQVKAAFWKLDVTQHRRQRNGRVPVHEEWISTLPKHDLSPQRYIVHSFLAMG
jgi:hypothetical protein